MTGLLPENTWAADDALKSLLRRWLPGRVFAAAEPLLEEMGRQAATTLEQLGDECERNPPQLRQFDGWGNRVDQVVYPEAWRKIAAAATQAGLVGLPYERESQATFGPDVRMVQAALCYLFAPSTATYLCPVAMTDGAARVLVDAGDGTTRETAAHLISRDPETAWTSGQWMTERQGGSDVGRNAVIARREELAWRLYGQKFFCSNIGSEIALALARPEGAASGTRGLALFLVPRDLPNGTRNAYRIDRLKDKLGTRAMATGEVTLEGAEAQLVGAEERGFLQMTSMLNITRLHNAITATALMRRAWMLAAAYARSREAFGRTLNRQPLHDEVLEELRREADLALYLTMRMAQLLGRIECGNASDQEATLFRLGIALTKLYTAKRAVATASEAIECFGGQGYMEDTGLPRLLRDAQVLPIWEGTTNILSLDALRVLRKPGTLEALTAELERLDAGDLEPLLDAAQKLTSEGEADAEREARRLAMWLARSWCRGLAGEPSRLAREDKAVTG